MFQIMRNLLILFTLFFPALAAVGAGAHGTKISQLADGKISGKTYSNNALDVRSEIPSGWVAYADPKGPVSLDSQEPDGPVNRCSKVLLSLHPAQPGEGGFNSTATLFAVDPRCFSDAKLPKALEDRKKILKFAGKIVKAFSNTPYITQKGADVDADRVGGRLIIILKGERVINAVEGSDQSTHKAVHVNTLLTVMESNGYWVVWSASVDDASRETLKNTNMSFRALP